MVIHHTDNYYLTPLSPNSGREVIELIKKWFNTGERTHSLIQSSLHKHDNCTSFVTSQMHFT